MATLVFFYALTAVVGLVPSGLAGTTWAMATGEAPRLGILYRINYLTPLKIIALCVYAPLGIVRLALWYLSYNPVFAALMLALGLGWSFLQGVFILTTFCGFS